MNIELESVDIDIPMHLRAIRDPSLWKWTAVEWHRLYRPYVPFSTGLLYNTVNIMPGRGDALIEHVVPYAHYAYEGIVYGPNVPISQGGKIVGYFSPEAPKHRTGGMMHYSGRGTRHWDEAAKPTQLPKLIRFMQKYVDSRNL